MILPMLERCLKMTISAMTTENGKKGLASQRLRNGRLTAAATDPAETILVTAMTVRAMTATARASLGERASRAPRLAATPFPPLKP